MTSLWLKTKQKKKLSSTPSPSCPASVGFFLRWETDVGSGGGGWRVGVSEVGQPEGGGWDTERKREAAEKGGGGGHWGWGVGGGGGLEEPKRD